MMRRGVAAFAAAISAQAFAATPVAFVADVSGSATIAGDGKLVFLAELEPGTRIFLGTGARAAITFARSGREFGAAGPGEFVVAVDEVRADRGTPPVRREVPPLSDPATIMRAARSATASLRMRGAQPHEAASAEGALQYPVGTRIATLQPSLRWRNEEGMRDTKVVLRDESGKQVWAGRASTVTVTPGVKLSAGTRYTWTVMTSGGVLGEAQFETLPAEPLARAERSNAGARSFAGRVLHALLLQELGASQDAKAVWDDLARERPDLPELARLAR
jgi:hypothetical protein